MVQKWAVGAMINISGSIAINLGTNLMKLSHKMKKGEYRQHGDDNDNSSNNSIRSGLKPSDDDDLEAAEPMIKRAANDSPRHHQQQQQQQQQFFPSSSRSAKRVQHGVEMTAYPTAEAAPVVPDSEPMTNGGARAGGIGKLKLRGGGGASGSSSRGLHGGSGLDGRGGGRGGGGADEEEMVGLTEESLTDSPSSTTGVSTSSDDRAAQQSRGRKALTSSSSSSSSSPAKRPPPKGGHAKGMGLPQPKGGGEYDEHPGVRKRPLSSSPNQGGGGGGEEGFAERGGLEASGGSGSHSGGAWEQQPPSEWMATALWYLGAVLLVAGSLVNFASFGFAPQSLLASLGSVQFISNVVFGKVILREMVTRRIILGTATIILGNTLTLCFSPHQDDNFSTHELKAFYDAEYNTLLLLELAVALAMHAAYKSFKRSKEQGRPRRHSDLVMPLAYAICSAIVGTQSVVNAKCLSELLTLTFQGENQMGSIFTYLVFGIWLGTTIFWLVRMNRALAMFHGLFIIPALQVFWTFFSVIDGGFYFEEFHTLHVLGGLGFAVGVLVVFCGVYLLAPRTQTDHGRHAGVGVGGEAAGESDDEESDLRRMLRLEVESPATSPAYAGTKASLSRVKSQSLDTSSMEAGDEEIDWDHTRMLSIGFFPSISTDQDVAKMGMGKLNARVEGVAPGAGDAHGRIHGRADGARVADSPSSRKITGLPLPLPWSKPKDTPPRPDPPTGNVKTFKDDSRSSGSGRPGSPLRAATGDRDRDKRGMGRGDAAGAAATTGAAATGSASAAAAQSGCREETERRRRWAGAGGSAVADSRGGEGGAAPGPSSLAPR